jgi:hypothetical protein
MMQGIDGVDPDRRATFARMQDQYARVLAGRLGIEARETATLQKHAANGNADQCVLHVFFP